MFIGHFLQKSAVISGSFAENDLQSKTFYEFLPPCSDVTLCDKPTIRFTSRSMYRHYFVTQRHITLHEGCICNVQISNIHIDINIHVHVNVHVHVHIIYMCTHRQIDTPTPLPHPTSHQFTRIFRKSQYMRSIIAHFSTSYLFDLRAGSNFSSSHDYIYLIYVCFFHNHIQVVHVSHN